MFPSLCTHYYWEEKREEIYRSAPTRTRLSRSRRGGARRVRDRTREREEPLECLSHGGQWAGHYDQLMEGLCGQVLPNRSGFKEELAATVCSCDDRDKEKCRDAAARFGFTAGSNLPPLELNNRMRFTELYFHNILNSPQFTEEDMENASQEDPVTDIIQGLHTARTVIYALVQRCVRSNDLRAYRLLDIIRLYVQKPNCCRHHLPLPIEEEAALEMLFMLEKGDHMNLVAKLFGCQIVLGLSSQSSPPTLDLNLSTANLNDIKGVEEYFQDPIGYKEPPAKPVEEEESSEATPQTSGEALVNNNEESKTAEPTSDSQVKGGIQEAATDSQNEGQQLQPLADSPTSGTLPEQPTEVADSTPQQPLDSDTATNTPITDGELTSEQTSESTRTTTGSTSELTSSTTAQVQLSDGSDSEQAISASNNQTNFSGDTMSDGPPSEQMATDETGSVSSVPKDTSDMQMLPVAIVEDSQSKEINMVSPDPTQSNFSENADNAMQNKVDHSITTNSTSEILA